MAPKRKEKKEWGLKLFNLCGRKDYSKKLRDIILDSRADSTHRGYERWVRKWCSYAWGKGADPFRPPDMMLANWLPEVAGPKSINSAISAIQGAFQLHGEEVPTRDRMLFPRLRGGSRRNAEEVNRVTPGHAHHARSPTAPLRPRGGGGLLPLQEITSHHFNFILCHVESRRSPVPQGRGLLQGTRGLAAKDLVCENR